MDSHLRAFMDRWQEEQWETIRDAVHGHSGVPTVSAPAEPDPEDAKPFLPSDED